MIHHVDVDKSKWSGQLSDGGRPTIWGLSAGELHDAYWRARGVQCVRRGEPQKLNPAAELFLLTEPDQCVLFDLMALVDRLTWNGAVLTRLRLVDEEERSYGEQVVADEGGRVKRICRRYHARTRGIYRVILTARPRIARIWLSASTRRDAWQRIRRSAGLSQIDNLRCTGSCFTTGQAHREARLISQLVELWPCPGQAIEGIDEVCNGVWSLRGTVPPADAALIGPVWLGRADDGQNQLELIGPGWTPDAETPPHQHVVAARLRDIGEVEPANGPRDVGPVRPSRFGYLLAKRLLDIIVSGVGMVMVLPVFVVVALWILCDDGRPVLYGHTRQTRGGRPFRCWKFRTMYRDAEVMKQQCADQNVCDGPQFYIRNDPRLTRVGRILRRYYIDELPQLWNVFVGQMSLVGPRPSPDDENQISPTWREMRLSVRPGMAGLWQLERTRRPGLDFQEWIRYDIEYVRRANFWLDLKILVRTIWVVLFGSRAYAPNKAR